MFMLHAFACSFEWYEWNWSQDELNYKFGITVTQYLRGGGAQFLTSHIFCTFVINITVKFKVSSKQTKLLNIAACIYADMFFKME